MDWDPLVNTIKNKNNPIISSISFPVDPVANYLSGEVAAAASGDVAATSGDVAAASICRILLRRAS
jgi:hypothetical protein